MDLLAHLTLAYLLHLLLDELGVLSRIKGLSVGSLSLLLHFWSCRDDVALRNLLWRLVLSNWLHVLCDYFILTHHCLLLCTLLRVKGSSVWTEVYYWLAALRMLVLLWIAQVGIESVVMWAWIQVDAHVVHAQLRLVLKDLGSACVLVKAFALLQTNLSLSCARDFFLDDLWARKWLLLIIDVNRILLWHHHLLRTLGCCLLLVLIAWCCILSCCLERTSVIVFSV